VNAELVSELKRAPLQRAKAPLQRAATRAWIVSALGGVGWALVQPYRITLLHPRGQGFWWLFVEPPLLVIAAGLFFYFVVVPGLLEDLEEEHATAQ
jgi:ABC-type amino acid transport system permease subunit